MTIDLPLERAVRAEMALRDGHAGERAAEDPEREVAEDAAVGELPSSRPVLADRRFAK